MAKSGVSVVADAKSTVERWQNCKALEKRLTKDILSVLKSTDKKDVKDFIKNPKNRLMLAQWMFANRENAVDTSKPATPTEGQTLTSRTMKEFLSGANFSAKKFAQEVLNDVEWMEQLAYSGEFKNPGRAMSIMAAVARKYKGVSNNRVFRAIATATALEWARTDWEDKRAIERAGFYIRNHKAKRFHKGFATLPFWQYRIICGSKGNNQNGSLASLEWALDNVHLPIDQYTGCCWQAPYLLINPFGESVHGSHYYAPYDDVFGANALQRTRDVGGVCGSLSHYGAFAAVANGVPAMPMGEPEHCAYTVCVNGKWVPAYSLHWDKGLHWTAWDGVYKFSSLHMASELYGPEHAQKTALSNAYYTLAGVYHAAGQKAKALTCYRAALAVQPCNYPAWRSYAGFLKATCADKPAAWKSLNKAVCVRLAPNYAEMAAELLKEFVYPGLKNAKASAADLKQCYEEFWKNLKGMGPDRWGIERLCDAQKDGLKSDKVDDNEARLVVYGISLEHTVSNSVYAPVILSWGNGAVAGMDERMQAKFLRVTLEGIKKGNTGDMKEDEREKILGQALLGAERMRDRSSVQAIGKLLPDKFRKPTLPEWEPFPGKLVSRGGLLFTGSTCEHDYPADHWGVLEPTGGRFHTGKDSDAYGAVELPKMCFITGVVTIAPDGNLWRLTNMKVQYSETGKDDDWHDAGAMPNPTGQRINRLDLLSSKPRARYIRILRPGGPEYFHLNAIFVYGEPAS